MPRRDEVERYVDETTPPEEVVERVKIDVRAAAGLDDEAFSRVLLAELPAVPEHALVRTRARIEEAARDRQPGWGWGWVAAPLGIAAAAALALVVTAEPAPVALSQALSAEGAEVETRPTPHVRLAYAGAGELSGTDQAPRLTWETGTVHVAVTPEQGVDFRVNTRDAEIRVIGTEFDVTRDTLGTRVAVDEGKVGVACEDGSERVLRAGESWECLPTTAAGLLGRARAFQAQGDHGQMLMAAEKGLALGGVDPALLAELTVVRIDGLVALGSHAEARGLVERYLVAHPGSSRAAELRRIAAAVALQQGDCAGAWPHLDALPERTADEQAWWASCPPE